jgi:hypothetical protein
METKEKFTRFALRMAVLIPILYFGFQILAAPFYEGYSFLSQDASTLGSEGSSLPLIFNGGAILTGLLTLIAAWGYLRALQQLDTPLIPTWLVVIALVMHGLGSLWAGFIPLPDPRHGANPFVVGVFLFPALLLTALWKRNDAQAVKAYLWIDILLFLAMIPVMSGLLQRAGMAMNIDMHGYQNFINHSHGLLQRVAALIFFPPIAVGAVFLGRRIRNVTDGS